MKHKKKKENKMKMFKVMPLKWDKEDKNLIEAGNFLFISENCIQAINMSVYGYAEILVTWSSNQNITITQKRAIEIINILEGEK